MASSTRTDFKDAAATATASTQHTEYVRRGRGGRGRPISGVDDREGGGGGGGGGGRAVSVASAALLDSEYGDDRETGASGSGMYDGGGGGGGGASGPVRLRRERVSKTWGQTLKELPSRIWAAVCRFFRALWNGNLRAWWNGTAPRVTGPYAPLKETMITHIDEALTRVEEAGEDTSFLKFDLWTRISGETVAQIFGDRKISAETMKEVIREMPAEKMKTYFDLNLWTYKENEQRNGCQESCICYPVHQPAAPVMPASAVAPTNGVASRPPLDQPLSVGSERWALFRERKTDVLNATPVAATTVAPTTAPTTAAALAPASRAVWDNGVSGDGIALDAESLAALSPLRPAASAAVSASAASAPPPAETPPDRFYGNLESLKKGMTQYVDSEKARVESEQSDYAPIFSLFGSEDPQANRLTEVVNPYLQARATKETINTLSPNYCKLSLKTYLPGRLLRVQNFVIDPKAMATSAPSAAGVTPAAATTAVAAVAASSAPAASAALAAAPIAENLSLVQRNMIEHIDSEVSRIGVRNANAGPYFYSGRLLFVLWAESSTKHKQTIASALTPEDMKQYIRTMQVADWGRFTLDTREGNSCPCEKSFSAKP